MYVCQCPHKDTAKDTIPSAPASASDWEVCWVPFCSVLEMLSLLNMLSSGDRLVPVARRVQNTHSGGDCLPIP